MPENKRPGSVISATGPKEQFSPDDTTGRPEAEVEFSGLYFRAPVELHLLMRLRPAELRVYLVVCHATQRDRHAGLLAISQIAERAGISRQHATAAIGELCRRRYLLRINRATGAELENPADWIGRTVKYALPHQWRQRDTGNLSPTYDQSPTGYTPPQRDAANLSPVGDSNLSPTGGRHLESISELESSTDDLQLTEAADRLTAARAADARIPVDHVQHPDAAIVQRIVEQFQTDAAFRAWVQSTVHRRLAHLSRSSRWGLYLADASAEAPRLNARYSALAAAHPTTAVQYTCPQCHDTGLVGITTWHTLPEAAAAIDAGATYCACPAGSATRGLMGPDPPPPIPAVVGGCGRTQ